MIYVTFGHTFDRNKKLNNETFAEISASTSITLKYNTEKDHSATSVYVYNMMGAMIDHVEQEILQMVSMNTQLILIHIQTCRNGIYLITLNIDGKLMTKRFVLTR